MKEVAKSESEFLSSIITPHREAGKVIVSVPLQIMTPEAAEVIAEQMRRAAADARERAAAPAKPVDLLRR